MDQETRTEFSKVWNRMSQFEEDSRSLLVLNETVKTLSSKVDGVTRAGYGIILAVITDLATHVFIR